MARPQRCRRICAMPDSCEFSPDNKPCPEKIFLSLDEYEVIRLVDLEGLTHQQCAAQMEIARSTTTEIYECARKKLADAVVNGKRLIIAGGHYRICDGRGRTCCGNHCPKKHCCSAVQPAAPTNYAKESIIMKIAVPYENGQIFQHFGHTEVFKLYEVSDNKVTKAEEISTNGSGHGALAAFLQEQGVTALICGGIGGGARMALDNAGISVYGGVNGSADEAAAALASGSLDFDPNARCSHHEHHDGGCGSHDGDCGSHHCGNGGCHH